jgi:hypothetical protein
VQVNVPVASLVFADPLQDESGFSVELFAERAVSADELVRLAPVAETFGACSLTRTPFATQCLVSVDDDVLWVSRFVTGPGHFDDQAAGFARAWFDDLWDAVHLGEHREAAHLRSPAQLLALARACRSMDWGSAVLWAGMTSPLS